MGALNLLWFYFWLNKERNYFQVVLFQMAHEYSKTNNALQHNLLWEHKPN